MTQKTTSPREKLIPSEDRIPWGQRLIEDVRHFHEVTGMDFTTLGRKAIKNSRIWERLQAGGTITVEKADEIYAFMATQGYHFNS